MVERAKLRLLFLDDLLTFAFWKGFQEMKNFPDANIHHSKGHQPPASSLGPLSLPSWDFSPQS